MGIGRQFGFTRGAKWAQVGLQVCDEGSYLWPKTNGLSFGYRAHIDAAHRVLAIRQLEQPAKCA